MRRALCFLSLAISLPAIGQAQQHAGVAMPAAPVAHFSAPPAAMAAPHVAPARPMVSPRPAGQAGRVSTRVPAAPKTVRPSGWNNATHRKTHSEDHRFANGNSASDCFPTPGLGFDFPHFFATHPDFGKNCRQFGSGFVVPFVDGGFYLPTAVNGEQPAPQQPAEEAEADEQQPPAGEPIPREIPASREKTQPVPKQQEYVFVKRDGTLIFAVAYSWINDRLQYVTEEGIRRTVPRDTLDLGATQQFNDQRGVPIQLPA